MFVEAKGGGSLHYHKKQMFLKSVTNERQHKVRTVRYDRDLNYKGRKNVPVQKHMHSRALKT